jgi:hypothetical protein
LSWFINAYKSLAIIELNQRERERERERTELRDNPLIITQNPGFESGRKKYVLKHLEKRCKVKDLKLQNST